MQLSGVLFYTRFDLVAAFMDITVGQTRPVPFSYCHKKLVQKEMCVCVCVCEGFRFIKLHLLRSTQVEQIAGGTPDTSVVRGVRMILPARHKYSMRQKLVLK